jgi:hypothetical protein
MLQRADRLFTLIAILSVMGCTPAYVKYMPAYHTITNDGLPNYSNLNCWAAHPAKKDPSDSVPQPLRATYVMDSTVDVFFLHPTSFTNINDTGWNASINDTSLNAKTDYGSILYQASVFNECRVFAPRYRQANLKAYYATDTVKALQAFELAYQDIKTAFQYYLSHYNNGHAIIIASHSQGSTHAQRLLREFFENKPLAGKLVAAYIAGMRIPKNYYSSLSPCTDAMQTGCFTAWRTFRKDYEPAFVKKEKSDCFVTNPITWTITEDYAARSLNTGSVLLKFNKLLVHVCDAQVHNGVLWVNKPHFPGSLLYRSKNYHVGDINLFYMNIRNNVRTRINTYRKNTPANG